MVRSVPVSKKLETLWQRVADLPVAPERRTAVAATAQRLEGELPETLREQLLASEVGQAMLGGKGAVDAPPTVATLDPAALDAIYADVAEEVVPLRKQIAGQQKELGKLESQRDAILFAKKGWFSRPRERDHAELSAREKAELLRINGAIADARRQMNETTEQLRAFGAVGQMVTAIRGESFLDRGELAVQLMVSRPWFPLPFLALIPEGLVQLRLSQRDRETGKRPLGVSVGAMGIGGPPFVQGMVRRTTEGGGYGFQPGITIGPFMFGAYGLDDALMGKAGGIMAFWPGGGFYLGAFSRPESLGGAAGFEGGPMLPVGAGFGAGAALMVGHPVLRPLAEPVALAAAKSVEWMMKPFKKLWDRMRDHVEQCGQRVIDRRQAFALSRER